jgi:murein tripeptide amidase MpaA
MTSFVILSLITNCLRIQVTNLLERLEFLVVPFVNPDGYEVEITHLSFPTFIDCLDNVGVFTVI